MTTTRSRAKGHDNANGNGNGNGNGSANDVLKSAEKTAKSTVLAVDRRTAVHECVSDEALIHLKSYKYSSVDKSPISNYILRHYWNGFVKLLPLWLAPNMVTLLGFFFILFNVALCSLMDPSLDGLAPSWVFYSYALGVWMYSTMDNVDGKQARRTGQSSGLGELFDHGIDSLNCTLASLLETSAVGLGHSPAGVFTALIPTLPMFFSTWETYHTHTLYLGVVNGPTEGLILACTFMLLSGVYSPAIWRVPIATWVGNESYLGQTSMLDIWVPVVWWSFLIGHLPACIIHVVKARCKQNLPVLPVFIEWTPIVLFTIGVAGWLYSPYTSLLDGHHLVLFCVNLSLVFGRMTTKIILAPFPLFTTMLIPLLLGALIVNVPLLAPYLSLSTTPIFTPTTELLYLYGYLVFSTVVYFKWAFLVIGRICEFLDINCLTITERVAPGQVKEAMGSWSWWGSETNSNGKKR